MSRHEKNYHKMIGLADEVGKRAEWEAMARRFQRENEIQCPKCLENSVETLLSVDMCIPNPEPVVEFAYQGLGLAVSCSRCGHKDYFEITGTQPEGMNIEKAFRRKQRKRRRKR